MHTKWQIWDFFKSFDSAFLSSFDGVLALHTFDPICTKMVKDFLKNGIQKNNPLLLKNSDEIEKDWIESEFFSLSLFQNQENFLINNAEDLAVEVIDQFCEINLSDRYVILNFNVNGSNWKKICQSKTTYVLEIEQPKFWETNKLLDFFISYFGLSLDFESKSWILEFVENSAMSFYQICNLLKLNHGNSKVVVADLKNLVVADKFDQFILASLLSKKKYYDFYTRLIELNHDFEKLKDLFRFLQSHFIKLADISFLDEKNRLTQYDKEIQKCSSLWTKNEIFEIISLLNHFEILCKKKEEDIFRIFKANQLESEISL